MPSYENLLCSILHQFTHTHWNTVGKRIAILGKLVTEHFLKQSILVSSAKTQHITKWIINIPWLWEFTNWQLDSKVLMSTRSLNQ